MFEIQVGSFKRSRFESVAAHTSVTLRFGESHRIHIDDVRVVRPRSGGCFVAMPTRKQYDADGGSRYIPTVKVDRPLQGLISSAVLDEFERWVREGERGEGAGQ